MSHKSKTHKPDLPHGCMIRSFTLIGEGLSGNISGRHKLQKRRFSGFRQTRESRSKFWDLAWDEIKKAGLKVSTSRLIRAMDQLIKDVLYGAQ